jgi:hypothetical protein
LLRTVEATRYVTPLREGGSLPAVVEADDLGTYVLKFRGAGQGPRALVVVLSASLDPKSVERATEAGADEILDKLASSGEIVGTIRRLGSG